MPLKRKENPQRFLPTCISIGYKFPIPCLLASHRDRKIIFLNFSLLHIKFWGFYSYFMQW